MLKNSYFRIGLNNSDLAATIQLVKVSNECVFYSPLLYSSIYVSINLVLFGLLQSMQMIIKMCMNKKNIFLINYEANQIKE